MPTITNKLIRSSTSIPFFDTTDEAIAEMEAAPEIFDDRSVVTISEDGLTRTRVLQLTDEEFVIKQQYVNQRPGLMDKQIAYRIANKIISTVAIE